MKDSGEIADIFERVGPLDEAISEIVRDAEDRWIVRLGDIELDAEFDARSQRLRFSVEIGMPQTADRESLLEFLLMYNLAARDSHDVVMALSGPSGSVMQLKSCDAAGLTPRSVAAICIDLTERAMLWRAYVVRDPSTASPARAEPTPTDYLLRV